MAAAAAFLSAAAFSASIAGVMPELAKEGAALGAGAMASDGDEEDDSSAEEEEEEEADDDDDELDEVSASAATGASGAAGSSGTWIPPRLARSRPAAVMCEAPTIHRLLPIGNDFRVANSFALASTRVFATRG